MIIKVFDDKYSLAKAAAVQAAHNAGKPPPRARRIALGKKVNGEMGARPRRRGHADCDKQRESHLSQIIRLTRKMVHEIAQRPLQKE